MGWPLASRSVLKVRRTAGHQPEQRQPECDVPVPGISHFFGGIGTGIGKNWYRKKVPEPVSEKFGPGKKSRNRLADCPAMSFVFVFLPVHTLYFEPSEKKYLQPAEVPDERWRKEWFGE